MLFSKLIKSLAITILSITTAYAIPPQTPQGQGMQGPMPLQGQGAGQMPAQGPGQAPAQGQDQGGPFVPVSTNDTQVQKAAAYAVQQLGGGRLVQVASAQKQGTGDVNYLMNIVVVNNQGKHQTYQVEVCIPKENIPWKLKSVKPAN